MGCGLRIRPQGSPEPFQAKVPTRRRRINRMVDLDHIDRRILTILQSNGRISNLDLAESVGLSPTPCGKRMKRLQEAGVIAGYAARINPTALGLNICAIMSVRLSDQNPNAMRQFLSAVEGVSEVIECLLVAGKADFMLRVWVKDMEALRNFLTTERLSFPYVAESSTMVVLDIKKSTNFLTAISNAHGPRGASSQYGKEI